MKIMRENIKYTEKTKEKNLEKPKTLEGENLEKKVTNIKEISAKWRKIALNNLKNEIENPNKNRNIEKKDKKEIKKEIEIKRIEKLVSMIYPITWFTEKELMKLIYVESNFDNWKNWIEWKWLMQLTSIAIDDFKERWLTHYKKLFEKIPSEFIQKMKCSSETKLAITKLKTRTDLDKKTYDKLIDIVLKEKEKTDVNLLMWCIHLWVKFNTISNKDLKKMKSIIWNMNIKTFNHFLSQKNKPTLSEEEFKKLQNIIIDYSDPKKTSRLIKYNWDPINKHNYPWLVYYIASLD